MCYCLLCGLVENSRSVVIIITTDGGCCMQDMRLDAVLQTSLPELGRLLCFIARFFVLSKLLTLLQNENTSVDHIIPFFVMYYRETL